MLGPSRPTTTLENYAPTIQGIQGSNNSENRQRKRRPWCDHFQKHGHTIETCWKIHEKLADWKPSRPNMTRKAEAIMSLWKKIPIRQR